MKGHRKGSGMGQSQAPEQTDVSKGGSTGTGVGHGYGCGCIGCGMAFAGRGAGTSFPSTTETKTDVVGSASLPTGSQLQQGSPGGRSGTGTGPTGRAAGMSFPAHSDSRYSISGSSLEAVAQALEARGSAGLTTWTPSWGFSADGSDEVTSCDVTIATDILMPTWAERDSASAEEKTEWDRFYAALYEHEEGHIAIVEASTSRDGFDGVDQMVVGHQVSEIDGVIDGQATKVQSKSDEYDTRTDHGRTQQTSHGTTIIDLPDSDADAESTGLPAPRIEL